MEHGEREDAAAVGFKAVVTWFSPICAPCTNIPQNLSFFYPCYLDFLR